MTGNCLIEILFEMQVQVITVLNLRGVIFLGSEGHHYMAVHTKFRLITYSQEIVDGQPIFVSSNCLPIKALKFEPAGHSFHSAALKLLGVQEDSVLSIIGFTRKPKKYE